MSRMYSAPMDAIAVTTATDLFHVTVTDTIVIHEMDLCQTTDLQDAAEEVLRIGLYREVTGGSGGTALTESPYLDKDDTAATAVLLAANSSISTGGVLLHVIGWNIRVPLEKIWTPETRPSFDSSEDPVAFRLLTAPADSVTISGTLVWEEF